MKWTLAITLVLFLAIGLIAQDPLVRVEIATPGTGGMISSQDVAGGQMIYGKNVDYWSHPGQLRVRRGLEYYGTTQAAASSFAGFLNQETGQKFVVGIRDTARSWIQADSSVSAALVGQLFRSDTNRTTVNTVLSGEAFPARHTNYDWTWYKGNLFLCDGRNAPVMVTSSGYSKMTDSTDDTTTFNPRVISLGMEAPGQLRVGIAGSGGPLQGAYKYAYAFWDTLVDSSSQMGLPSATVYPDSERVYLTQFDLSVDSMVENILVCRQKQDGRGIWNVIDTISDGPGDYLPKVVIVEPVKASGSPEPCYYARRSTLYRFRIGYEGLAGRDTIKYTTPSNYISLCDLADSLTDSVNASPYGDSIQAYLIGNKLLLYATSGALSFECDVDSWATPYVTLYPDSIGGSVAKPIIYIDTIPDSTATVQWNAANIRDSLQQPGAFRDDSLTSGDTVGISYHGYDDSLYWIAYSYYDPVIGIESSMGPAIHVKLVDTLDLTVDSVKFRSVTTCAAAPGRAGWIRVYQGVVDDALTDDSGYYFGLFRERIDTIAPTFYLGNWTDNDVGVYTLDTATISIAVQAGASYRGLYDFQVIRDLNADPIMRPPNVFDLQVPLSRMAVAHNRIFGIGDPEYPTYVYYSAEDTGYSWNPLNYIQVGNNVGAELVGIEELDGTIVLFGTNGVWALRAANVGLTLTQTEQAKVLLQAEAVQITGLPGAINGNVVCKYRGDVYWLGTDFRVWSYKNGWISAPVENWIDTLFTTRTMSIMDDKARLLGFDDVLHLVNDSSGSSLGYHIPTNTWAGVRTYGTFIPFGTMIYDSTASIERAEHSEILFDTAAQPLRRTYRSATLADQSGEIEWAADFFLGGDGFTNIQPEEMSVWMWTFDQRNWLRYAFYDHEGDLLGQDSVYYYMGSAPINEHRALRFHTPVCAPQKYLTLRLSGQTADSVYVNDTTTYGAYSKGWIEDVKVLLRMTGYDQVTDDGDTPALEGAPE